MSAGAVVVDGAIVGSVAASVAVSYRLLRRPAEPGIAAAEGSARRRWLVPEALLGVVVVLFLVNQVLFNVYVLRVHGGDPGFISRYLGPGWFAMDEGDPLVRLLARHCPVPPVLLAPSVLRVQAFLELPLVLLAYASVLRWLDAGLYRRVMGSPLLWCASASYTVAFCTVEWDLRNPYTGADIGIRVLSAVATPPVLAAMARRERGPGGQRGQAGTPTAARLLLFCVSVGLLGYLVLVLYNTVLLYNLGLLSHYLPGAGAALSALVGTRVLARRAGQRRSRPGPAVALLVSALGWFLVLFFVPALAVRYGENYGTPALALAGGAVTVPAAAVFAVREQRVGGGQLLRLGTIAVAAVLAAVAADRLVSGGTLPYEAGVLAAFVTGLTVAVTACAASDGRKTVTDPFPGIPLGPYTLQYACTLTTADGKVVTVRQGTGEVTETKPLLVKLLPDGASCKVWEPDAAGAVSNHPDEGSAAQVVIDPDTSDTPLPQVLTIDNHYPPEPLLVEKKLTGAAASLVGSGPFTVSVDCTDGGASLPDFPRDLVFDGAEDKVLTGLPVGARCTATETGKGGAASTDVAASNSTDPTTAVVASVADGIATLTVTNDFPAGSVTLHKLLTGPGAAQADKPFRFRLDCDFNGRHHVVVRTAELSRSKLTESLTGLPAGASCTLTETDTGGADRTPPAVGPFTVTADTATEVSFTNHFSTVTPPPTPPPTPHPTPHPPRPKPGPNGGTATGDLAATGVLASWVGWTLSAALLVAAGLTLLHLRRRYRH